MIQAAGWLNTQETLCEFERSLAHPEFRGVPLGSALAQLLLLGSGNRGADLSIRGNLKNWARLFYYRLRLRRSPAADTTLCKGRVLVTWLGPNFRYRDLVFPVIERLGRDRCAVLYAHRGMADLLPSGTLGFSAHWPMYFDGRQWRQDFGSFWREFKPVLKRTLRHFGLPSPCYAWLAAAVLTCTQTIAGYQTFLGRSEMAAVLTEYDRSDKWAPLVLSAKALGIPTYTLMHGVTAENCLGYYPLLANTIFCWGSLWQEKFEAAGVDPARILLGGCPRITADLSMSPAEARALISLDPHRPVVVLATANYPGDCRLKLAEAFCRAVEGISSFSSFVRLHPADRLHLYDDLARRYPAVRFVPADAYALEAVLAAADVVVVHSSSTGSDALVKGRLTVVLDVIDLPLGPGRDLVELAGCPRATTWDELRSILPRMLEDSPERRKCEQMREEYVGKFCALYGDQSARYIADRVLQDCPQSKATHSRQDRPR